MSVPRPHERLIECREVIREPNWVTGDLRGYNVTLDETLNVLSLSTDRREVEEPLQQSDLLRPFYMDIARHGLSYAYKKFGNDFDPVMTGSKSFPNFLYA